jgi:hypothetical protein
MSEVILGPDQQIPQEIRDYGHRLEAFAKSKGIPDPLIADPDHAMIKVPTPAAFNERYSSLLTGIAEQPVFTEIDFRFIVAARLLIPISLTPGRILDRIEIMEAKSPEGTADYLGVEYTEFFYRDFNRAVNVLNKRQVPHELRHDGIHRWISMRMNDEGQEMRITDRRLAETLDLELDGEMARKLGPSILNIIG